MRVRVLPLRRAHTVAFAFGESTARAALQVYAVLLTQHQFVPSCTARLSAGWDAPARRRARYRARHLRGDLLSACRHPDPLS